MARKLVIARGDRIAHQTLLNKLSDIDLLIIDDFLAIAIDETAGNDLFTVLVNRDQRLPTVIVSQSGPTYWVETLPEKVAADSIVNRLANHARTITLGEIDMRRLHAQAARVASEDHPYHEPVFATQHIVRRATHVLSLASKCEANFPMSAGFAKSGVGRSHPVSATVFDLPLSKPMSRRLTPIVRGHRPRKSRASGIAVDCAASVTVRVLRRRQASIARPTTPPSSTAPAISASFTGSIRSAGSGMGIRRRLRPPDTPRLASVRTQHEERFRGTDASTSWTAAARRSILSGRGGTSPLPR
ncbi:ATP-binding protein [Arthrobacter sp. A5]|uniref:ATP-binding protein n=1 Tax=Arthrobacter sp. A5 TaxID=576926 RepID=UPI003DA93F30